MPPRLADVFGTGMATRVAATVRTPPPLKRVAPRRGDPPLDPRALARAAAAYDERLAEGHPMPKYPMALDAAPQDGRWLDDPEAVKTVLQFLMSKLSPADLAELDGHLTEGTTPQAQDRRLPEGNLKANLFQYTPKNRRGMLNTLPGFAPAPMMTDAERDAIHKKLFPHEGRLK